MPEAIVALGEVKRVVGRLRFETDGRHQHSQFEYAAEWLASPDRFALSPGLPLREDVLRAQGARSISLDLSASNGHSCGCSFGPSPDH
ncbi:HipA N-terminal domain-containing protein [Salaquimonas pukyongi]|uniref:HipA N-terminal domain-containing protein n=1 Tax=Salaquimonas pukyongi TaxID=2712698 RepID=UPI00096B8F21